MREPLPVENWTIVIPVKGTPNSKSRLGASGRLARAIALDTVTAATGAGRVIVVTTAAEAPVFERAGAVVVTDPGGGLNSAVVAGVSAAGSEFVAVLLGDVAALQPAELAAALSAAEGRPLAFVADADETGTVLITALRAADHRPAFGLGSRKAHLAAGYVELDVPRNSGLRNDIDTPEQLAALAARLGPHTTHVA